MNTVFPWREAPEVESGHGFAVIGDPVSHSKSPLMHHAAYRAFGLPYSYHAIHVQVGEVDAALDHLKAMGYVGINVTVPHKERAWQWSRFPDEVSSHVRAANTLRLSDAAAINTDAPGFMDTLDEFGMRPGQALLLGAGGSARAIAYAMFRAGWKLALYNRTESKAHELRDQLGIDISITTTADPLDCELIVNMTSASLQHAELPIRWSNVSPSVVAVDLMYSTEPTVFLLRAAELGLRTSDGLALLAAQGARSFEWWTGLSGARPIMTEALKNANR
jgi:shikimate dehydrogenase